MKTLILVAFCVVISATLVFSQPILKSEPAGNVETFYIMTINGQEFAQVELKEKYNWLIFKDIADLNLPDGQHEIKLRVGNDQIESEDVMFYIRVEHYPSSIKYEIIPDPENLDPNYLAKFTGSMTAEVYNDDVVVVDPPEDNGGGGGGGGCFINTLIN
jgi:hypothetical protein